MNKIYKGTKPANLLQMTTQPLLVKMLSHYEQVLLL